MPRDFLPAATSLPGLPGAARPPRVLVIADAAQLPANGLSAAVTIHYYDRYQVDGNGNPVAGQGVTRTMVYTVEDGFTKDRKSVV